MGLRYEWTPKQLYRILRKVLKRKGALKPISKSGALTNLWDSDKVSSEEDHAMICEVVGAGRWSSCYAALRVASCPQAIFEKLELADLMYSEKKLKGMKQPVVAAKQRQRTRLANPTKKEFNHFSHNFLEKGLFSNLKAFSVDWVLDQVIDGKFTVKETQNWVKSSKVVCYYGDEVCLVCLPFCICIITCFMHVCRSPTSWECPVGMN